MLRDIGQPTVLDETDLASAIGFDQREAIKRLKSISSKS
jgi:hypothetical protein